MILAMLLTITKLADWNNDSNNGRMIKTIVVLMLVVIMIRVQVIVMMLIMVGIQVI